MMKRSTLPRLGVHCRRALVSVTLLTFRCVGGAGTAVKNKKQNKTLRHYGFTMQDSKVAEYACPTVYLWS